jgi:hypothetical protein
MPAVKRSSKKHSRRVSKKMSKKTGSKKYKLSGGAKRKSKKSSKRKSSKKTTKRKQKGGNPEGRDRLNAMAPGSVKLSPSQALGMSLNAIGPSVKVETVCELVNKFKNAKTSEERTRAADILTDKLQRFELKSSEKTLTPDLVKKCVEYSSKTPEEKNSLVNSIYSILSSS